MPNNDSDPNTDPNRPGQPPEDPPLTQDQLDQHRQGVVANADTRMHEQQARRDDMRLNMMRSIVTEPLLSRVQDAKENDRLDDRFDVIIALNEMFSGGVPAALDYVKQRAEQWHIPYSASSHYIFANVSARQILALADEAHALTRDHGPKGSVVYRVWEDTDISASLTRSLVTVKVDAAQRAFQARGDGIVWAVLDSGIAGDHPHFKSLNSPFGPIDTLSVDLPLAHTDYTPLKNGPLVDAFGHGTHVAGIIAGYWASKDPKGERVAGTEIRDEATNTAVTQRDTLSSISGAAPACKLVSMKVIADSTVGGSTPQTAGQGKVSWVLRALDQIQEWNQHGKRLLIHGVNMSLGYDFDPRWFACGQSPICVEVNRLVKSGVSVVVSAGNAGYSSFVTATQKAVARYSDITITDPGNAELAITVGSTHREMPHMYGVSYFSSRGPTGDGRMKPDVVAPGERIISCAAGIEAAKYGLEKDANGKDVPVLYCEQTGTSMAAPHVSGAIAAFLSVRREFIGEPEQVKEIFLANTIDLRRERKFQGNGLLDLMKVLQAV
jgi:subtilisin family serine protease